MGAGFMAGFGTTLSNSIEADREYYREAASKRRDYLQTYGTKAVVDREDKANAAMGVVNTLKTRGFDTDTLRFTVDTAGIQGLLELDSATKNRDDLSKEDISGIVKMSKDYVKENPDMDLQQVISRAYGLYKSTDNPAKRESNIFAAVLGLDSGLAEDEVLDDIYVNGFTGRDIYRIMGSSGPKAKGALDLNVPKKPLANATLVTTANVINDRFEANVNAELNVLKSKGTGDNGFNVDDSERKKYLETLLGMGTEGMVLRMNENPTFRAEVSAFEESSPGSITNNPYIRDLGLAYEAGPPVTSVNAVTQYKTQADLAQAIANGEHKEGDQVQVNDGKVLTLKPPRDEPEDTQTVVPMEVKPMALGGDNRKRRRDEQKNKK
jgi:hypothetical protein